jgi:hypothetical protein
MPPVIIWALGAIGALVVGRWLAREAQRIQAGLRARDAEPVDATGREEVRTLERDPVTGIYRPK